MSALPPKADMDQHGRDVRFVPSADIDAQRAFTQNGLRGSHGATKLDRERLRS